MKSHPCAECGRFAFPKRGTVCYWCKGGETVAEDVTRVTSGPLTTDQLRTQLERERRFNPKGAG